MIVFVKEDEAATSDCISWLGLKIGNNVEVGGNVGSITRVVV